MQSQRIGIFGGTFDPPHLGHLILASEIRAQLGLDRLLWVLTPAPPHKREQAITPLAHRLAMVQLALDDDPAFELSRVEIERPGPHYSVDTLRLIQQANPRAHLVFLMGGDSLRDLPRWRQPQEIVRICHEIGVMRRPGDRVDLSGLGETLPGLMSKVRFVDAPLLEIASRELRRRAAQGRPIRYYLPEAVYRYIHQHHLYQTGTP